MLARDDDPRLFRMVDSEEVVRSNLAALRDAHPQDVLAWGLERFGDQLAITTSFQIDGVAMIDMASRIDPNIRIVSIDTGRLPEQTYTLMDEIRERYGVSIEVFFPSSHDVERFVLSEGVNSFRHSVELRKQCCEIRKVRPLDRVLDGLDAWVSGLRKDQSQSRREVQKVEVDWAHGGIVKLNPLSDWTEDQVWEYVRAHDVPYHQLYDRGYTSIGCAPCTRPTVAGEDARAGRWWWEVGGHKECGMHCRLD